jgi:adenylate kinase
VSPVIIFHGPPNAGKSSQARQLAQRHHYVYISSGEVLRHANDPVITARLASGQLALSEDVERLMQEGLRAIPADQTIVIDGFPRMLGEFHHLEEWLADLGRPVQTVFEVSISEDESHRRSQGRGRHDDHAIAERWRWYRQETAQVLDYCATKGWLVRVDGLGTPDEVAARIEAAL